MLRVKDRLSGEAITGVIAYCNSSWSEEHRCRHDRRVVPRSAIVGTTLPEDPAVLFPAPLIRRHGHYVVSREPQDDPFYLFGRCR